MKYEDIKEGFQCMTTIVVIGLVIVLAAETCDTQSDHFLDCAKCQKNLTSWQYNYEFRRALSQDSTEDIIMSVYFNDKPYIVDGKHVTKRIVGNHPLTLRQQESVFQNMFINSEFRNVGGAE